MFNSLIKTKEGTKMSEQAPQELLQGPRQEGVVPLPSGAVEVHEVTGDGMKQTRIVGSGVPQAEFQAGIEREAARVKKVAEDLATARANDPNYDKQFMPPAEQ